MKLEADPGLTLPWQSAAAPPAESPYRVALPSLSAAVKQAAASVGDQIQFGWRRGGSRRHGRVL